MLKKIIIVLLRYSGLPFFIRKTIQKNRVTIIYYHRIEANHFDRHLALLKKNYHIVSLQSFVRGETKNIKNRLIITFDDGHVSNFELLPVLKKHDVRITIFITTGLIDANKHYWFLLRGLGEEDKGNLKRMSDEDRLAVLRDKFQYSDTAEYDSAEALSRSQILAMAEFVDFQSHTVTHPCLPKCSAEKALAEIRSSKEVLEKIHNKEVNCIAFPNNDYSEREIRFSLESGYKHMLTANYGFNVDDGKYLMLKRLSTNDTKNLHELMLRVTGVWKLLRFFPAKQRFYGK